MIILEQTIKSRPSDPSGKVPGIHFAMLSTGALGSLGWMMTRKPISQDRAYHGFVDRRRFLGVPNFNDVASNLPFLAVGLRGVRYCLRDESVIVRAPWTAFFAGVALTGAGSGYYHLRPDNETLVWDRLPMSIAFMSLFAALIGEQSGGRPGLLMLAPALAAGGASVIYWHRTDDLRPYYWVQLVPLLAVPMTAIPIRQRYSHHGLLLGALGCYALAKVAEAGDAAVFRSTRRALSGHTLKHFFAAAGCYAVLRWLRWRKPSSG